MTDTAGPPFTNVEDAEEWMENHNPTPYFADERHVLVAGMVLAQLAKAFAVVPLVDVNGNYTQHYKLFAEGGTYRITIEPYDDG